MLKVLLFFGLFLISPMSVYAQTESSHLKTELKQKQKLIEKLKSVLKIKKTEETTALKTLDTIEQNIHTLNRTTETLSLSISETEKQLEILKSEQVQLFSDLEKRKQEVKQQVRALYIFQKNSRLKLLLSQQNVQQAARLLRYYYYIEKHHHHLLTTLLTDIHTYTLHEQDMNEVVHKLSQLKEQKQTLIAQLKEEKQQRHQLLAALKKEIQKTDRALNQAEQRERVLTEQLLHIQTATHGLPNSFFKEGPFSKARGKLLWPLRTQIHPSLVSPFTIKAPLGEFVYSAYDGQVVFADWLRGFGLLMIVDHGEGFMSLYGHNQALYKNLGDKLKKGDIIAKVGDSGGLENSGLYFEIRKNGKPVNLVNWFK